jgi:hypothetical protein
MRFDLHGDTVDIEEAIALRRESLTLRPPPHPDRSNSLHNLARALQTRFEKQKNPEDINEAIELHKEALAFRPPPYLDRAASLQAQAVCLSLRNEGGDLHNAFPLFR